MAQQKRDKESDEVTITLAHPLSAEHAVRLGLDDKDYNVDDDVKIRRDLARSVINSGYAQVDPEDQESVNDSLGLSVPKAESNSPEDVAKDPGKAKK